MKELNIQQKFRMIYNDAYLEFMKFSVTSTYSQFHVVKLQTFVLQCRRKSSTNQHFYSASTIFKLITGNPNNTKKSKLR